MLPGASASGVTSIDGAHAADVLAYAQDHYAADVGPNGRDDLTDAALRGIMSSVHDPYTVYLSPREIRGLNESLSGGNFGGIGVYIYQLKDGRIVVQPIEAMPAATAGMKPGEVVDSVDGKPVRGLADRSRRGDDSRRGRNDGAPARASRTSSPRRNARYTIVREIIHVPTVRAKMEGNIDYVRLSDFGTTSGDEVRKALLAGKAAGARAYILDLRDNGGGLLDAAVEISSLFIPQGTIVSTIRRDGQRTSDERARRRDRGPASARHPREQVHGERFGDYLGRAAGLPSGDAGRHAHVRQGRRAEHLSVARIRGRSR